MFNLEKRYTVFIYYHVPCLAVGISKIGNSERYLGDCFFIILLKRQSFIYLYIYTYIYIYIESIQTFHQKNYILSVWSYKISL